MAYSQEIEDFIGDILADGVITEKEREVLLRKAAKTGIDPDELNIVIDGRLARLKQDKQQCPPIPMGISQQVTSNRPMPKKCPACGAPYQPGSGVCPDCGQAYQNLSAINSVQQLADGIERIRKRQNSGRVDDLINVFFGNKDQEVASFITNFPIPNTKEDLLEFIISMEPKCAKDPNNLNGQIIPRAYRAKYKEAINKAKVLFPNDSQFQALIQQSKKKGCLGLFVIAGAIALLPLL